MSYGFTERRIYVVSTVPTSTAGSSMNLKNNYEQNILTIIKLFCSYVNIGKSL